MNRNFRLIIIFALITFMLCGCSTSGIADAKYGVIYTTEYEGKTEIQWLDEDFSKADSKKYNFSGAAFAGQSNSVIRNGQLILLPDGNSESRDYGKIVCIDLLTGDSKEVEYGRTNVTGWAEENGVVAIASNLNNTSYVDFVSLDNEKQHTIKMPDGFIAYDLILFDDNAYAIVGDLDDNIQFCRIGDQKNPINKIESLDGEEIPGFLQKQGNCIYFISNGSLIKYDAELQKVDRIKLTQGDAFSLHVIDDEMWIAYTDIYDMESKSLIELRTGDGEDVLQSFVHDMPVLQIERSENQIIVVDYSGFTIYELDDDKIHKGQHVDCNKDGFFMGGFFLTNGDKEND